jgi:hypothetical protein
VNDTIFSLEKLDIPNPEKIDIKNLKSGSDVLILEASVAMQVGKIAPIGYDQVSKFFHTEHGRTTPSHNV